MTLSAESVLGKDIASKLVDFWGIDEEGEHVGAFKPCGVPNIWMSGGGCGHARYFTRLIALQILSETLGEPVQPFKETKLTVET